MWNYSGLSSQTFEPIPFFPCDTKLYKTINGVKNDVQINSIRIKLNICKEGQRKWQRQHKRGMSKRSFIRFYKFSIALSSQAPT